MTTAAAGDGLWVLERAIRRDKVVMALGLAALTLLAWTYLARAAASMSGEARMHAAMGMADMRIWGVADWFGLFVMWAVMMVAMMLPSAAPVILLVVGMYRRRQSPRARLAATVFVSGYIVAWTLFSAFASALQAVLHGTAIFAADMRFNSPALSAAVLLAAGVYQWLPAKNVCLSHCQSPLGFLSRHWREGAAGGLVTGMRHGLFCVGCCWLLMAVLFAVGVMNLAWVAAIAGFVLVEKLLPRGAAIGRVAGAALVGAAFYVVAF